MDRPHFYVKLKKLGWLTLVGFTVKGILTTSLIFWAIVSATGGA